MQFGANDMQAAQFADFVFQFDVGTAACHVRGDGDFATFAGGGDDLRFALDVASIENHWLETAGDK